MKFCLRHMMSNCAHPEDYLIWWENFDIVVQPPSPTPDLELRDRALWALAYMPLAQIVRLTFSQIDQHPSPEVRAYRDYRLRAGCEADDRVFTEYPSVIHQILMKNDSSAY